MKRKIGMGKINQKWTPPQRDELRRLHGAMETPAVIAQTLNAKFGTSHTPESVRCYATFMGLRRPHLRPPVAWTDAMVQTLRDGVKALHTMARIGRDLNLAASAVNAKRIALGIVVPKGVRRTPEEQQRLKLAANEREQHARELKRRNRLMNFVPPEYRQEAPLNLAPDPVTDPLNLTMDELVGRFQCRWITSDALSPPLYCGHPTHAGTSWCEKHHLLATLPYTPKRAQNFTDFIAGQTSHHQRMSGGVIEELAA